ncbi:MAG: CidA/LrgA family protein [Campylobacter sp.]
MKFIKQVLIIFSICFIAEILNKITSGFLPTSILALILMFLALQFRIIRPAHIKETAIFLIEIMPILFIPLGVGLIKSYKPMMAHISAILVITIVSTAVMIAISSLITQKLYRLKAKKRMEELQKELENV